MGFQFETDHDQKILHIRITGVIDKATVLAAVAEAERQGVRHYGQLWDFADVTRFSLVVGDVGQIVASAVERAEKYGDSAGRLAIVARDSTYASIGRLVTIRSLRYGIPFALFSEVAEARAWLTGAP